MRAARASPTPSGGIWLLLGAVAGLSDAGYAPPTKFLLVTNARNGTVGYLRLPAKSGDAEVLPLITSGLGHPQGIAVDQKRRLLVVADPELRKVVSYGLAVLEDGSLGVDGQTSLAENVETRWVAVDGPGNVYFTDELGGWLLKVTARQVLDGDTSSAPVEFGGAAPPIALPGGVATDNFHLYWTNKQDGQSLGTVAKVLEGSAGGSASGAAQPGARTTVLARNVPKAYGLCLAMDNVFFTDSDSNVFVVKRGGGEVRTVSSKLRSPRGCAWDGDSTIFVADRAANGIFAFDGPMTELSGGSSEARYRQVAHFQDAFGLAVFSGAPARRLSAMLHLGCLGLAVRALLARRC
mmetsp:Transcript_59825/g.175516  ORF Transcript_59825/g.175516 Transcript_59825/m.175516 type:complete len:351 (-) Transcript_59825:40-1092(-)